MVLTNNFSLPTYEELEAEDIPLSTAALKAGSNHYGKVCEFENNEFVLCRKELNDPRKCISEGKAVTNCTLSFFRKLKATCFNEFQVYADCIDKSSGIFDITKCRNTQAAYDKCVFDNLGIERPPPDYFVKPFIHDSKRPAPEPEPPLVFEGLPAPAVDKNAPRERAKYGSRLLSAVL